MRHHLMGNGYVVIYDNRITSTYYRWNSRCTGHRSTLDRGELVIRHKLFLMR